MTQSLAQLRAEWETPPSYPADPSYEAGARDARWKCASALQPHVEREAAAQAKSLADERRIAAAETISRIYFEIAAEIIGEDKVRAMFNERFELARAALRVGDAK